MVTWQNLFAFCTLIVAVISLVIQIIDNNNNNKK